MAKLYPPVIEGTIPAFNGTDLTVPFSMNRSVSIAQIGGFALKIKTIQSNTWLATVTTGQANTDYSAAEFRNITASWTPVPGQFYKIQLAYIDNETHEVGYFSTVGVVKYTSITKGDIDLQYQNTTMTNPGDIYPFTHEFAAVYTYDKDPMEKIYQYKFNIYDSDDQDVIFYTSDWLLHDATQDSALYKSVDTYIFANDLPENKEYELNYEAVTVNGLHLVSPRYKVTMSKEMISQYQISITAENNYDNGYVQLKLRGSTIIDNGIKTEQFITGQFKIYRRDLRDNKKWEEIFILYLQQQQPSSFTDLKDFTVEHGATYEYKICQFNNIGMMAICGYSAQVYVDFEDMFLFDGEHQLNIRFNPKVSSFKNDILESKIDTIGSKYPFFFRNGIVKYKEFPISGLISYLMDNEALFMSLEELGLQDLTNVSRNYTVTNPSYGVDGAKYHYNYSNVSTDMRWIRQNFYNPVTHWVGNQKYFTYDEINNIHNEYTIIEPDVDTQDWTYADYNAVFQDKQRDLRLDIWEIELAKEGQELPNDKAVQDAYLAEHPYKVLYVQNKSSEWNLVPFDSTKRLTNTKGYEWSIQTTEYLSAGAIAHAVAVEGYRSVVNTKPMTTDLVNYNIAAERQFKLNVLEWLTNGQPKLFRSPAEGNYIVRLLNTSLTPTDSLGRMLHTFSSTAYEIDDLTYENLVKYGFIKAGRDYELSQYPEVTETILLYKLIPNTELTDQEYQARFLYNATDNSYELLRHPITLTPIIASDITVEGFQSEDNFLAIDGERKILLDPDGSNIYHVWGLSVRSLKFYPNDVSESTMPILTYTYRDGFVGASELDAIVNLKYSIVPMRQFIQDVIPESTSTRSIFNVVDANTNVLNKIEDAKTRLAHVYQLSFERRSIVPLYCDHPWSGSGRSTPNGQLSFNSSDITNHFNFNPDIDSWDTTTTLTMLAQMPIDVYLIRPVTRSTLTRAAGFVPTETIVYEKVLSTDILTENNVYYILNSENPIDFVNISYSDIAADEDLIDILYIQRSVILNEYELPADEGRHCYIDGVKYESTEAIQSTEVSIPRQINVYTRNYVELEDITDEDPLFAVFDTANSRLQILDNFDTKVYMNTGNRQELPAETKEEFDLTNKTIDVGRERQYYIYYDLDNLTDIYIGNGVLMSMSYQILITTYNIESHARLAEKRAFYDERQQALDDARRNYTVADLESDIPDPGETPATLKDPYDNYNTKTKTLEEWAIYAYEQYIPEFLDYMQLWEEDDTNNG